MMMMVIWLLETQKWTQTFFLRLFGRPQDIPAKSRDIPPKSLVSLGSEGHTELLAPHPFTWKTPTPPESIRTKQFGLNGPENFSALLSTLSILNKTSYSNNLWKLLKIPANFSELLRPLPLCPLPLYLSTRYSSGTHLLKGPKSRNCVR